MSKAARAIILNGDQILLMRRNKNNAVYYTLVGGKVNENESVEQALIREVKEETGLDITGYKLVFIEEYPEDYNDQYTFLCDVAPFSEVGLQKNSEEAQLNRYQINVHELDWADTRTFKNVQFRTPTLQKAIIEGLNDGFPEEPIKI